MIAVNRFDRPPLNERAPTRALVRADGLWREVKVVAAILVDERLGRADFLAVAAPLPGLVSPC